MRSKSLRLGSALVALIFMMLLFQATAYSQIIRVKSGGDDANTGENWTLAKKTVQAAIDGASEGDEIWVAAGSYEEHIQNKVIGDVAVNVALYGGFAGTEDFLSQREYEANLTVLHGTNNGTVVTSRGAIRIHSIPLIQAAASELQPPHP